MIAKKMTSLFIGAMILGLGYMGWKLTSRSAYESAEYSVLETDGNIELREYPELMLATTDMGSQVQGGNGSFGRLFQYISGNNEDQRKVAMTTPVFMEPQTENLEQSNQSANGQMSFVLPKDVVAAKIPVPSSTKVQLTKRTAGKFAAIKFAGRMDSEACDERRSQLESWIETRGLEASGKPEFASYDPPWTPGPLRRNEILIRVRGM